MFLVVVWLCLVVFSCALYLVFEFLSFCVSSLSLTPFIFIFIFIFTIAPQNRRATNLRRDLRQQTKRGPVAPKHFARRRVFSRGHRAGSASRMGKCRSVFDRFYGALFCSREVKGRNVKLDMWEFLSQMIVFQC